MGAYRTPVETTETARRSTAPFPACVSTGTRATYVTWVSTQYVLSNEQIKETMG